MKIRMLLVLMFFFVACQAQKDPKEGKYATKEVAEHPADTAVVSDIWTQKAQTGVDFVAMGNEPSWSLEIDFEKSMVFTSLNEPDTVVTPVPEGLLRENVTATSFTAETENGTLGITISEQTCSDAMSGEGFEYKVTVSAKTNEMSKPAEYSGCGRYLNSSPLNGAWQLVTMKGQSAEKLFGENVPFLEFHLGENNVVGSGGCNHLSGSLEVQNSSLIFSPLISTKMACPVIEAEQQLLDVISEKELEFSIKGEKLILKTGNEQLVFERLEKTPER